MADINFNFVESGYTPPSSYIFDFGATSITTVEILAGTSNNITSIWADPTANISTAKFYTGSTGTGSAFSVVDLQNKVLYDSYTISDGGQNDEPLEREDIKDINIVTSGA